MTGDASEAPRDLIGFLDFYLVKKAPFQIPENAKEWIVKWGPWITVVLMVLSIPPLLIVLGLGTLLIPFGGVRYASSFSLSVIVLGIQVALMIMALPGLIARKMSGWQLLFYSQLISIAYSLLSGAIVSAIVVGLISLYILFQIRPLYRN